MSLVEWLSRHLSEAIHSPLQRRLARLIDGLRAVSFGEPRSSPTSLIQGVGVLSKVLQEDDEDEYIFTGKGL